MNRTSQTTTCSGIQLGTSRAAWSESTSLSDASVLAVRFDLGLRILKALDCAMRRSQHHFGPYTPLDGEQHDNTRQRRRSTTMRTAGVIACVLNVIAGIACLSAASANVLLFHLSVRIVGVVIVLAIASVALVGFASLEQGFPLGIKAPLSLPVSSTDNTQPKAIPHIPEFVVRSLLYVCLGLISCDTTAVPQPRSVFNKWTDQGNHGLTAWMYANSLTLGLIAMGYFVLGLIEKGSNSQDELPAPPPIMAEAGRQSSFYGPPVIEKPKKKLLPFRFQRDMSFRTKRDLWLKQKDITPGKSNRYERHRHDSMSTLCSSDSRPLIYSTVGDSSSHAFPRTLPKSPLSNDITPKAQPPRYVAVSSLRSQFTPPAPAPKKGNRFSSARPISQEQYKSAAAYGSLLTPLHKVNVEPAPEQYDSADRFASPRSTINSQAGQVFVQCMGETIEMTTSAESSSVATARSCSPQPQFKPPSSSVFSGQMKPQKQSQDTLAPPRGRNRWITPQHARDTDPYHRSSNHQKHSSLVSSACSSTTMFEDPYAHTPKKQLDDNASTYSSPSLYARPVEPAMPREAVTPPSTHGAGTVRSRPRADSHHAARNQTKRYF